MPKSKTNDSSIFKIDKNGTLTEIKEPGWNLQHFEIPEGVKCIDLSAFKKVHEVQSLTLPSTFQTFNGSLLKYYSSISNIINHSPVLFGWWVNRHKYGDKTLSEMETIDLDKYTNSDGKPFTKIYNYLFSKPRLYPNLNLRKFNTGSFITKIEQSAFVGCKNLKHVEIGKNVQSIGCDAFFDCSKLESENFISYSPVLFDWWVQKHRYGIEILSVMKTIDLDKYTNSDGKPFTIVSEFAFYECFNVQNILFGNAIKQIDRQNFRECDELKNIQITNKEILLDPNAFYHIPKTTNFYVLDKQIKEKLQKIGVDAKQIFIKPIPKEELEEPKEHKIELTC